MGKDENREICVMENGTIATGYPLRPTEELVPRKVQWPLLLGGAVGGAFIIYLHDSVPSSTLCLLWFSHTSHSFLPSLIFFTSHKHTDQSQQQGSQPKIKCDLVGLLWEGHLYVDQPGEAGLRGLCGPDMLGMWWGTRQSSWSDHNSLGQVTITLWIRPEEFGGSVTKADDRADDSNVDYSPDLGRTVNSLSWALITNGTFIRFLKCPMDRLILAHSNWQEISRFPGSLLQSYATVKGCSDWSQLFCSKPFPLG